MSEQVFSDKCKIIEIEDIGAPELDVFVRLTGAQLRNKLEPEKGIFIAESPTVIEVALNSGYTPVSLLTDKRLINGAVEGIIERCAERYGSIESPFPVYTADRDTLASIVGFELTRGALCAMKREREPRVEDIIKDASRIAVLEAVTDSTNIGALIRSAAALNIDALLITPTCCDPLCRRAIRVSMGTVFQIPWTRIGLTEREWQTDGIAMLKKMGFLTCAMALSDDSIGIDDEIIETSEKIAIILGTEGTGLSCDTIAACDRTVRIPMSHGVDSLNVAAAGAIAFWQIGRYNKNKRSL